MNTAPVCLIVFNRLDLTREMMSILCKVRPRDLYVVSDGPRKGRSGEAELVVAVRQCVETSINWECNLHKNYSDTNLGCHRRVSSGISWLFTLVAEAIILEDDCHPEVSFFPFATAMLERYRDDTRIMHIGGSNYNDGPGVSGGNYYFSHYPFIWGWATWSRAWKLYDYDIKKWSDAEVRLGLQRLCFPYSDFKYWSKIFDSIIAGETEGWDYKWIFCCWVNSGLAVIPNVNLICNRGFREDATHTTHDNGMGGRELSALLGPYNGPNAVLPFSDADVSFARKYCVAPTIFKRVILKVSKLIARRA